MFNINIQNTWCPGCGNFGILETFKKAVVDLEKKGTKRENIVFTAGIGCHAKIFDYLNLNSFYGLHGRAVATAEGIKLANPNLKVVVFSGDGDSYNEGISHLIHAAKRNIDITVIIHDNRIFALTTGQFTATSPKGLKGKSTPNGSIEEPFNPLELMLASGATFIARGYSAKTEHLKNLIVRAIEHKGFSFIEVLQPCISLFNNYQFYQKRIYETNEKNLDSKESAMKKIQEWDYKNGENKKIPIGVIYQIQKPSYDELSLKNLNITKNKKERNIEKVLKNHL
ncbi:MAG: thiamine pyrophosphate-dependent enzyme [Minisyncoccales bacterium]